MKKILSLLLSLVMLLSVTAGISFTAQAADGTYKEMSVNISSSGQTAVMYFTPSETGDYYFYTYDSGDCDTYPVGLWNDNTGATMDDKYYYDDFFGWDFAYFAHLTKNVTYLLRVGIYESSGSFTVVVDKNPIKKVTYTGKTSKITEFTNGHYDSSTGTDTYYYDSPFSDGDTITLTLDDGSVFIYTVSAWYNEEYDLYDYEIYDANDDYFYGYWLDSDQEEYDESVGKWVWKNPWKVGKHSFDLMIANFTVTIPIEIVAKGWYKKSGKWYYSMNGADAKGWVKAGGKWYFMDKSTGVMKTGWVKDGGKWYYMNSSGAMVTGWQKISGKWYYFNSSGVMLTGWQKIDGKWYYFNSGGDMKTGWLKSGGKWYYLDDSGAMLANTSKKIGKKTYKFDKNGVCTNP